MNEMDEEELFSWPAFGARVKQAREAATLSQAELARRLSMTRSSVANIEAGRQKTTVGKAAKIAADLRCDPCWLLVGPQVAEPPVHASERIVREMRALADEKPSLRLVLAMQDGKDATKHGVLRANCTEPEALNLLALATWRLTLPHSPEAPSVASTQEGSS
jgi:transcriptional regulator with XRE-family HTH domain